MDLTELQLNRNLQKDTTQVASTQGAIYTATNPSTPANQPGNYSDVGAPDVLTGTVITSCFIQTSALPYRMTLQNNELTIYDDTTEQNGKLIGNASRIVFTHDSATKTGVVTSGFILQKRASTLNSYDNILELFSPDNSPNTNLIFIGRTGTGTDRNISLIEIAPDYRTAVGDSAGYVNGVFRVRTSVDGANSDFRDGLYIMDRGTESSSRSGSVDWFVAAGEGGQVRLSYMPNRNGDPVNDPIFELFISASGFTFFGIPASQGAWSGATAYTINQVVSSGGSLYRCILGNTNHVPPNATYWVLMQSGGLYSDSGTLKIA